MQLISTLIKLGKEFYVYYSRKLESKKAEKEKKNH